jgi:hypothetical protein
VVVTVLTLMEFKISTVGPTRSNAPPSMVMGEESEEIEVDVGPVASLSIPDGPAVSTSICTFNHATAIVLGEKNSVGECDGPFVPADSELMVSDSPAIRSTEFVRRIFKFGPNVPPEVITQECLDIIEFEDTYSWHEFDLGCITDVPHAINVTKGDPMVFPSCPVHYLPKNEQVLRAKCMSLVDMGEFVGAVQDCKNRAQVVVARRPPAKGGDLEDLRNYRVAHDFRV